MAVLAGGTADARGPSLKKAIWGPLTVNGQSQFPVYADLGVGIYETTISWANVAPSRPANAADPADPAYRWPAHLDLALSEASRYGIRVLVEVNGAPKWANGGRAPRYAPRHPGDYGTFLDAASRRFPGVRYWLIEGEPSKKANFLPPSGAGRRYQRDAPRWYARMLAAAYHALKRVDAGDVVIGGNTWTVGDIDPPAFLRALRLPSGRPPPMDLYGHNPYSIRRPALRKRPIGGGILDFSDLDTLAHLVDRNLGRRPGGGRLRLFLSEFTLPTDHPNWEFNFWFSRRVQADWLGAALRIVRHWSRIYSLGWLSLYDDPPRPDHQEVDGGLIDNSGRRKPAYAVFRDG